MRWMQIARKDFEDTHRDRQLYYLLAVFGLVGLAIGYFIGNNSAFAPPEAIPIALLNIFAFLAPITALTIAQADIVGKRATGELAVLLSLPFSRHSIVVGSFLGRALVMTTVLVPAFVFGPLLAAVQGAAVDPVALVGSFLLVWLLSLIFTAIALGISALTRSTSVSAGASFGIFLLFVLQVWTLLPTGIRYLLNGFSWPTGGQPTWATAFTQLSPFAALRNVADPVFSGVVDTFPMAVGSVPPNPPSYQQPIVAGFVVLAWIILPLAIGYYRFQTTDL